MNDEKIDADVVRTLAQVAGIKLPEEDVEPLVGALRNHLAGMKALEELDIDEADPIVAFDARWQ